MNIEKQIVKIVSMKAKEDTRNKIKALAKEKNMRMTDLLELIINNVIDEEIIKINK